MEQRVLIFGASARAAAFSALRAGLRPWCADLFADADLEGVCPVVRVPLQAYPKGLQRLLDNAPIGPWLYTGALENWPGVVQRLAQLRPLWGNDASVLRRVRRPWEVAACLRNAGLPCPEVRRHVDSGMARGRWLVKPLASAGGRDIRFWGGKSKPRREVYFQEYIEGAPCAAVYAADTHRTRLLGVTQQLVGELWLHAAPFQYCGNVGPLSLTPRRQQCFLQLGEALAREFGLRGLFGVDCILRDGVPYPVEINPRYTASVEVIELATELRAVDVHRRCFDVTGDSGGTFSTCREAFRHVENVPPQSGRQQVVGKAIFFAREKLAVPRNGPWTKAFDQPFSERGFADIPPAGQVIEAGQPILTLLTRGDTISQCLDDMRQRVQHNLI